MPYSFTGAIIEPRQVLSGGYLSWVDPTTNDWWQETWFDGSGPQFRNIGPIDAKNGSLRSQIDRVNAAETAKALATGRATAEGAGLTAAVTKRSTTSKAAMWRAEIDSLVGAVRPQAGSSGQRRTHPRVKRGD